MKKIIGYVFKGWYNYENCTDDAITEISGSGDKTVYAKFDKIMISTAGGDNLEPYLGMKGDVLMSLQFNGYAYGSVPAETVADWATKIEWTSNDSDILDVDKNSTTLQVPSWYENKDDYISTYGGSQITLPCRAKGVGKATLTGKLYDKIIAELYVEISDKFTQDACSNIARSIEENKNPDSITKYEIPNGYTSIRGNDVFSKMENLKILTIPSSVTSIAESSFGSPDNISTVIIKGENPPTLEGANFHWNNSLQTICVPYSALATYQSYCDDSREGWKSDYKYKLKAILTKEDVESLGLNDVEYYIVPDSIGMIAENAFENCTKLKGIVLPYSVAYIADEAFANCTNLESVTLYSVPTLGDDVFKGCSKLKVYADKNGNDFTKLQSEWSELTTSPNDFFKSSTFDEDALAEFYPNTNDETIDIPFRYVKVATKNNTEVSPFKEYSNLQTVTFASSVTTIGNYAFTETAITEITIPETITEIMGNAFSGCAAQYVYMLSKTPPSLGNNVFKAYDDTLNDWYINDSLKAIYVPAEGYVTYTQDTPAWYNYNIQSLLTKEEVQKLKATDYASTKTIVIPCEGGWGNFSGIIYTEIANDAFSELTDLEEIEIPESIMLIYAGAFKDCKVLKKVKFYANCNCFSKDPTVTGPQYITTQPTDDNDPEDVAQTLSNNAKHLNGTLKYTADSWDGSPEIDLSEYDWYRQM